MPIEAAMGEPGRAHEIGHADAQPTLARWRRLGVRLQDVFISLVEVKRENWSFGNGVAQYAA